MKKGGRRWRQACTEIFLRDAHDRNLYLFVFLFSLSLLISTAINLRFYLGMESNFGGAYRPTALFRFFHVPTIDAGVIGLLGLSLSASLLLILIGFRVRACLLLAALFYALLCGYARGLSGYSDTSKLPAIFALLLLASAKEIHHFSPKRIFTSVGPRNSGITIFGIKMLLALMFLGAGIAKLRSCGVGWANPDQIRWQLLWISVEKHKPWLVGCAGSDACSLGLGASALGFELLFPFFALFRKTEWIFAGGAALFLSVLFFAFGMNFFNTTGLLLLIYLRPEHLERFRRPWGSR